MFLSNLKRFCYYCIF